MHELIHKKVQEKKEEIIELTQKLVRMPSITGEEEQIIELLTSVFNEIGFDEVFIDEMGNLIGRLGTGEKILAIDGHVDTVEIGMIENWKYDPFGAEIQNERIYGRGSCDQKGGLASTLIAVKILKEIGFPKDLTLYVLASVNEELFEGMNWQHIISKNLFKPDAVILTEPSNLHISLGHRGRMDLKVEVKGTSSHGAEPDLGINAIYLMSAIIDELIDLHTRLPEDPFFGKATLAVTDVNSSTVSFNAVPHNCQIHIDRRLGINDTKESVIAEISELPSVRKSKALVYVTESNVKSYKGMNFEIEGYYPTWIMDENDVAVKIACDVYETQFSNPPQVMFWRFSTNGVATKGMFDIPTIGFGPGNEEYAHTVEEHVQIAHLLKATEFYTSFALEFVKSFEK